MYPDNRHIDNLEHLVLRMARCLEFATSGDRVLSAQSMQKMAEQARDYLKREARGQLSITRTEASAPMSESNEASHESTK